MSRRSSGASSRTAAVRDLIQSNIWPIPTAAIVLAVVLGIVIPTIDRQLATDLPGTAADILFEGSADAARTVLSAIAGSLITATSLTFSLTVVALQLASSQASPRLLRLFASDGMVHATMAVFLGTFAYALTVLRTVRTEDGEQSEFVPHIAVTLASVMTLVSVIMLALFLAHLARQLRIETMLKAVSEETRRTLRTLPDLQDDAPPLSAIARPSRVHVVPATRSGFLDSVDHESLIGMAQRRDLIIAEESAVGSSVIEGTPLAYWWPLAAEPDRNAVDDIERCIRDAMHLRFERTAREDVGFGLRQLADVALKAVSPGINDPTTAVHALSHASALLCELVQRPRNGTVVPDDDGAPRVIRAPLDVPELLEVAVGQLRHYGTGDPRVAQRMVRLLREVAHVNHREDLVAPIRQQIERTLSAVRSQPLDAAERERIEDEGREAFAALTGTWAPAGAAGALLAGARLEGPDR